MPIQNTEGVAMLYIFVGISISISHFVDCIRDNFTAPCRIALVSTIQFITSLQVVFDVFASDVDHEITVMVEALSGRSQIVGRDWTADSSTPK